MKPMIPYHIRKAYSNERERIRDHLVPIHLLLSVRNEQELIDQTKELVDDFPALYDNDLFTNNKLCHYLLAVSDDDDSLILGSIGMLDKCDLEEATNKQQQQLSVSEQQLSNTNDDKDNNSSSSTLKYSKLNSFFTSIEYQHMGIGSKLMNEALQQAKLRGIQRIDLLTMREVYDNAITCYLKFGFQVVRDYTLPNAHYQLVDMSLFL